MTILAAGAALALAALGGPRAVHAGSLTLNPQLNSGTFGDGGAYGQARWDIGNTAASAIGVGLDTYPTNGTSRWITQVIPGDANLTFSGTFMLSYAAETRTLTYVMSDGSSDYTVAKVLPSVPSAGQPARFNTLEFAGESSGGGSLLATNMQFAEGPSATIPDLSSNNSFHHFYLYSLSDLVNEDFTITGELRVARGASTASQERSSFSITLEQSGAASVVPLPTTASMGFALLGVLGGLGVFRKRRDRALKEEI